MSQILSCTRNTSKNSHQNKCCLSCITKTSFCGKSTQVTVASNTYCSMRAIHTSPNDDCKKPDAITTGGCVREQSKMFLSLFFCYPVNSWLPYLFISHTPPQVECREVGGEANKREQRFILSHRSHLSLDEAREWTETEREHWPRMRHNALQLGYQLNQTTMP